jgi:hypothetical protein
VTVAQTQGRCGRHDQSIDQAEAMYVVYELANQYVSARSLLVGKTDQGAQAGAV